MGSTRRNNGTESQWGGENKLDKKWDWLGKETVDWESGVGKEWEWGRDGDSNSKPGERD